MNSPTKMPNEKTAPHAVIFDMDGVLVDSYQAHWLSWESTCNARHVTITTEQYARLFGQSFETFVNALAPDYPADQVKSWHDQKEAAYREIVAADFPEMPGASLAIKLLADAGFLIGVATSGSRENVDLLIEHLANGSFVRASASVSEVSHGKPHPDVYLACANALGVDPANCVAIEDSLPGLEAARTAGMVAVGLTGTATREQLTPQADSVITRLSQLTPDMVTNLLKPRHETAQ